jgi:hypothetical protein
MLVYKKIALLDIKMVSLPIFPGLCFAGWLSVTINTLWSTVEYSHHKVYIFLLCGVQFTCLQPDNQPA